MKYISWHLTIVGYDATDITQDPVLPGKKMISKEQRCVVNWWLPSFCSWFLSFVSVSSWPQTIGSQSTLTQLSSLLHIHMLLLALLTQNLFVPITYHSFHVYVILLLSIFISLSLSLSNLYFSLFLPASLLIMVISNKGSRPQIWVGSECIVN